MAASAWHNAVNTANTTSSYASLPNGSCNFRPLSTGSQAPTCGCRRFWLDKPLDSQNGSSVLCACGHHACFHDVTVDSVPPPSLMRHSSAPSVPSNPDRNTSLLVGPPIEQFGVSPQDKSRHDRTGQLEVVPISNDVWGRLNNFARWQQDPAWIPSTAPASVLSYEQQTERPSAPSEPSPVKSTTSNERRYASLFPNMDGLMASPTVQGTPTATDYIPDSLQVDVPSNTHRDERETRSTQSQPAKPVEPDASERETEDAKPCLEVTKFVDSKPQETPSTPTKTITPDVHNILQSCVRRLESLETYSFSHVPLDEVQEKFELFDGRLLELEYWKKDIDARLEKSHLALEDKDSQASTSFQDLQTYAGSKALFSRVSEVEDRLADLESAQPSYANPWEIEVVLLPFGRTLQGLWHTSSDTESNQLPSTPAAQCDEERTSDGLLASTGTKGPAWTADTIEAWASTINPWLWPKAPGPNSNMFKRLQSRGLVRTVSIVDTGAHGIWESVKDAFADFVETQRYHRSNNQQQPYEALREAFVPLRKIKKSSWLRYLETHELITPATWDISFLDSGVFMNGRGGRKRLYMTTADGYIQPGRTGWTWQQIRDLPRYENLIARSGTLFSREAPSEPFWKHVPALDDAPSFSSFVSQHSNSSLGKRRSSNVTFEDHEMESPSAKSYTSSSSGDTITPRYSESFPIIAKRTSDSKRRTSPSCTPVAYQKRRRISGSPSRYRGGLEELTPRWSHEPPTPLLDNIWETRSQCRPGSSRKRLSTPTAYATPHSHNVANVVDLAMADGGDTEVESVGSGAADSEKEWGGLEEDEDDNEQPHQASQSSFTDSEWMAENDDSFYQEEGDADDGDSLYEP